MYQVIAATNNSAKIDAIYQAFSQLFIDCHIQPVSVNSGVPNQPIGNAQILTGARNRVKQARQLQPDADFWLAIEAGIEDNSTFSWVVIESRDKYSQSRSASLPLPDAIIQRVLAGATLEQATQAVMTIRHITFPETRQFSGQQQGTIGLLTAGKLTRSLVCQQAIILALSPFHHPVYG